MSSTSKKSPSHRSNKVKYKRNVSSVVIQKNQGPFANKIHTIGSTEGVMIAYVTKPTSNKHSAYTNPIEHYLHEHEDLMQQLKIGTISRRRSDDGENIQMALFPGSKYPFHCFVRVVGEVKNNTVQARNEWAQHLCRVFNRLGSDGKTFNYPSSFVVCREHQTNDNNELLPVAKYLLNNNVLALIRHIYPDFRMDELAAADDIVRSFWGDNHFDEGRRLMFEDGSLDS